MDQIHILWDQIHIVHIGIGVTFFLWLNSIFKARTHTQVTQVCKIID
jgi:hypothetical protein